MTRCLRLSVIITTDMSIHKTSNYLLCGYTTNVPDAIKYIGITVLSAQLQDLL